MNVSTLELNCYFLHLKVSITSKRVMVRSASCSPVARLLLIPRAHSSPFCSAFSQLLCQCDDHCTENNAYGAVLAAFFAQGEINWQKESILRDLRQLLHVSDERHRFHFGRLVTNEQLMALATKSNNGKRFEFSRVRAIRALFSLIAPQDISEGEVHASCSSARRTGWKVRHRERRREETVRISCPSARPHHLFHSLYSYCLPLPLS